MNNKKEQSLPNPELNSQKNRYYIPRRGPATTIKTSVTRHRRRGPLNCTQCHNLLCRETNWCPFYVRYHDQQKKRNQRVRENGRPGPYRGRPPSKSVAEVITSFPATSGSRDIIISRLINYTNGGITSVHQFVQSGTSGHHHARQSYCRLPILANAQAAMKLKF